MKSMLVKVGWKKDMVEKSMPFLPICGWMDDNLKKAEDVNWVDKKTLFLFCYDCTC